MEVRLPKEKQRRLQLELCVVPGGIYLTRRKKVTLWFAIPMKANIMYG